MQSYFVVVTTGPVSAYPQRIKRTNVRYGRGKSESEHACRACILLSFSGSLLFSKPQTEACTTTSDIVKVCTM